MQLMGDGVGARLRSREEQESLKSSAQCALKCQGPDCPSTPAVGRPVPV